MIPWIINLLGLFTIKFTAKRVLILPLALSYVLFLVTFYYYLITSILYVYNLINGFFSSGYQNMSVLDFPLRLLNAMGVTDGINNGLTFLVPAVIIVLSYFVYKHTAEITKNIFFAVKTVI